MVLDQGELKEFDTPENLLARDDSLFATLVRNAAQAGNGSTALASVAEEEEITEAAAGAGTTGTTASESKA